MLNVTFFRAKKVEFAFKRLLAILGYITPSEKESGLNVP
jgi:hypothetical protein